MQPSEGSKPDKTIVFTVALSFFMHEESQREIFINREVITLQLKQKTNFKIFLKYLIPSMLSMALMAVYTFTDTFVVGRKLGAIALGAMGICTPVLTVTYALGFLYGMGGGALYSIDKGKKDTGHANKIFTTSFIMLLATGLVIMAAGNLFIWPPSHFLGADKENIAYVIPYLHCIVSYAPGFMLDVFLMTYLKNDGHPNVAMVATVTGTVLNIILDCIFVFVFKWGMFGAAFATCIGSGSCSAISIFYILKKRLNLIPRIKNICGNLILRILQAGFSVFVLECSSGIVTFVFISQATKFYGTIGASIYTVIMNWTLICFNLIMGIAQSVQPLISISCGEQNHKKAHIFRKYALNSSLAAGALFLLIGYTLTEPLIAVFSKDAPELIQQAADCFRLYLPAYFIMGISISIGIYFQAIEASAKSLVVMLMRGIIMPVAAAFILPLFLDKAGLWISVPFAEFTVAAIAVLFLIHSDKHETAKTAENLNTPLDTGAKQLIITISREFGSGGRVIGREIAGKLGIPVYDKEVPEFAEKGSCVIIGRCADYVLHSKFPTLNIFIHAPLEMRIKRIMKYDRCTEKQTVRKITESDKARAGYHDFFTHSEWGIVQNYDLTLNSSLGLETSVKMVLDAASQKGIHQNDL